MASRTTRADFEAVFPGLVEDLSEHANKYGIPPAALDWYQKVNSIMLVYLSFCRIDIANY